MAIQSLLDEQKKNDEENLSDLKEIKDIKDQESQQNSKDEEEFEIEQENNSNNNHKTIFSWNEDNDQDNPRNWIHKRKLNTIIISSAYTFLSPACSSMLSPAISDISVEFNIQEDVIKSLLVSIFILPWAFVPLFMSPISEMYGRKKLLNYSIWFMFCFNLGCALSKNTTQLIVFRFLAGCGGAAPLAVGAGVIGDLFSARERNFWGCIYAIGPISGPTISPILSGFIVQYTDWRWVFWVQLIINGIAGIIGSFFLEETYAPVILKEKLLNFIKENKDFIDVTKEFKTIYEINQLNDKKHLFYFNIMRPFKLLFLHPIIIGLGIYMAIMYGLMYLMICTFPNVWGNIYGFNKSISGLMFFALAIGYIGGLPIWNYIISKDYERKIKENNNQIPKPEARLKYLYWSGIISPTSLLIYGWMIEKKYHWVLPAIFCSTFAFAIICMFQTISSYLIDMNPRFAASSIAAATFLRSVFGFTFPLFVNYMFRSKLKYGWSNTIFSLIGFMFGIPFPIFVYKRGERLREWANRYIESW
ncbi:MFS transporter [Ascoidea rubescens DSM 1968]|uniref:MFS multidrug transporter n=1 Tax=Ascoidea rubescens DSM 1968 TaxID=1344418 RepID=A0A1D2VEE7_9ASCO|nr:MFS multidrug transporter [Ascoidea rubescens DSM 1968]ODV59890.1 MFS multidrug transporter [Ascoidea rubescens DSM 1968]